jgi:NAD-dependent SIR2 family protein deacetylase
VLSGAGCSTASGIPDYRDDSGNWKHPRPVQFPEFVRSAAVRQRYWARSFAGWSRVGSAAPNPAHVALARLEAQGRVTAIITQNVDNLHRLAGSRNVIDLHGVLHRIRCLGCGARTSRGELQERLEELNADWHASTIDFAPDGDARLADPETVDFAVPDCGDCGAILKPDVVFFGEPVPARRVVEASEQLQRADALLVVGSSLMVFSGFRFARMAHAAGIPLAILNRGTTRADQLATYRAQGDCCSLLSAAVDGLTP